MIGYERFGENNSILPASEEEIDAKYKAFHEAQGIPESMIPEEVKPLIRGMFSNRPYIEGAWMDKHNGKYYLQYACPGAQFNTYSDGVYVSDSPLGDFTLAKNNPYSYKPGGFLPGAGHGSTMEDKKGNLWHTAAFLQPALRRLAHGRLRRERRPLARAGMDAFERVQGRLCLLLPARERAREGYRGERPDLVARRFRRSQRMAVRGSRQGV